MLFFSITWDAPASFPDAVCLSHHCNWHLIAENRFISKPTKPCMEGQVADYEQLRQDRFAALTDPTLRDYYTPKRPPLRNIGVNGLRAMGNAMMASLPAVDGVTFVDNEISGPNGPIPTRIYTPKASSKEPRGIYLHTHGGGYVMFGGLDATVNLNSQLAHDTDCIVVAPDFRLPPEHPFPIPLQDCFAAFLWTAEHAERLGGRSDGICVGGGCTGANLAAAVTIMARDAGGPQLGAQYLYCPVFDMSCEYQSHYENSGPGYTLSRDDCLFVYEQYLGDWDRRFDPLASVILTPTLKGLPPTLIDVGEWDVLRDESIAYANRLRDAGVDVTITVRPEVSHGSTPLSAGPLQKDMTAFLARTVGPGAPSRT